MSGRRALVLVDLQNDFCPGGALAVREGDQAVAAANRLQPAFDLVVATQDWHPPGHLSFAANHPGRKPGEVIDLNGLEQVLWPVHCVQDTPGADFHPALDRSAIVQVFQKGVDREIDSYSGFHDNGHRRSTGLAEFLREKGVDALYIAGLATDYCVKYTALDSLKLGFETNVVQDACRAVNLKESDEARALAEMKKAGAHLITVDQLESAV